MKAACQLYQLRSARQLHKGDYVAVNGPWDRYGIVIRSEADANEGFLNLIRGCEQETGDLPVVEF